MVEIVGVNVTKLFLKGKVFDLFGFQGGLKNNAKPMDVLRHWAIGLDAVWL
jgi:hypothetical protein